MRKNNRSFFYDQNNADYNNIAMTVDDIASDKIKQLHDEIYSKAVESMKQELLSKYLDDSQYSINITEQINTKDPLSAPNVIVIVLNKTTKATTPLSRFKISLDKWWTSPKMFSKEVYEDKFIKNVGKFARALELQNYECVYKDYVKGTCQIKSKITDGVKKISLDMLNNINKESIQIPDSEDLQKIYSDNFYSINA